MFVTPTAAGGMPLAFGITPSESEESLTKLFKLVQKCLPSHAFYGRGPQVGPAVFLIDGSVPEQKALQHVWDSEILLCSFHVLQAVWRWLCSKENGICEEDRQPLFRAYRCILYAVTFEECAEKKNHMQEMELWKKYPKFQSYFAHWWKSSSYSHHQWAHAFRQNLPYRGSNTTNFVEVVMRIIKDLVLYRTKAFNQLQLLVFLTGKLDDYYSDRCLDAAYIRCAKLLLLYKSKYKHKSRK